MKLVNPGSKEGRFKTHEDDLSFLTVPEKEILDENWAIVGTCALIEYSAPTVTSEASRRENPVSPGTHQIPERNLRVTLHDALELVPMVAFQEAVSSPFVTFPSCPPAMTSHVGCSAHCACMVATFMHASTPRSGYCVGCEPYIERYRCYLPLEG
jgi:hypothetical protein